MICDADDMVCCVSEGPILTLKGKPEWLCSSLTMWVMSYRSTFLHPLPDVTNSVVLSWATVTNRGAQPVCPEASALSCDHSATVFVVDQGQLCGEVEQIQHSRGGLLRCRYIEVQRCKQRLAPVLRSPHAAFTTSRPVSSRRTR
jgi:hypothetical protein